MKRDPDAYLLRSYDPAELGRLDLQHRVWKSETDRVIAHAGFRAGDQLADLGCGPGFVSADLARLVGPDGRVHAIDSSESFVEHARALASREGLTWIDARVSDLNEFDLEDDGLDGAVCRWVLMYLPDARSVVRRVVRALKPGGRFVVIEYSRFQSSGLWPDGRHFGRIHDGVRSLIQSGGGDPDIGARVPALLDEAGCDVVELLPIVRIGRPGSKLWEWMEISALHHAALLAEGRDTSSEVEEFHREWEARAGLSHAYFSTPPVLATIGCKR